MCTVRTPAARLGVSRTRELSSSSTYCRSVLHFVGVDPAVTAGALPGGPRLLPVDGEMEGSPLALAGGRPESGESSRTLVPR